MERMTHTAKLAFIKGYLDEEELLDQRWVEMVREYKELLETKEQGLLVRLPCNVGDTVYTLNPHGRIVDGVVESIHQNFVCQKAGRWVVTVFFPEYYGTATDGLPSDFRSTTIYYGFEDFSKTVFHAHDEAMKEREGK